MRSNYVEIDSRYVPQTRVGLDEFRINFDGFFRVEDCRCMIAFASVCSCSVRVVHRIDRIERDGFGVRVNGFVIFLNCHVRISCLLMFLSLGLCFC